MSASYVLNLSLRKLYINILRTAERVYLRALRQCVFFMFVLIMAQLCGCSDADAVPSIAIDRKEILAAAQPIIITNSISADTDLPPLIISSNEVPTPPSESRAASDSDLTSAQENMNYPDDDYDYSSTPNSYSDKTGSIAVIVNKNSRIYHAAGCPAAKRISDANKDTVFLSCYTELESLGFRACKICSSDLEAALNAASSDNKIDALNRTDNGSIDETENTAGLDTAQPPVTTTANTTIAAETAATSLQKTKDDKLYTVVLNISTKKLHVDSNCRHIKSMKEENKLILQIDSDEIARLIEDGYTKCKTCSHK